MYVCMYVHCVGFLGFTFALIGMVGKDGRAVLEGGFFQGYSYIVWLAILLQVRLG